MVEKVKKKLGRILAIRGAKATGGFAFVVVFPLLIAFTMAFMGLPVKGFGWVHGEPEEAQAVEPQAPTVVDFTSTPAGQVMTQLFKELDKKWQPTSPFVNSAGLPHPLNCVTPPPSLSGSEAYKADVDLQVTFAAYPAGMGALAYEKLSNDTINCKPPGTSIYPASKEGLGVEATTVTTTWSTNRVDTTYWRRGDVIVFVATDGDDDSFAKAKEVDALVAKLLTPVCVDEQSKVKDQKRNAFFAKKSFTGLLKTKPLVTPQVEEPELTDEQIEEGVKKTALPAKNKKITKVDTADNTSYAEPDYSTGLTFKQYPLWPELPKAPAFPEYPTLPAPQKLKSEAVIRIEDPKGPGCGWKFLTTVEADFDAKKVEANNKSIVATAQKLLDDDGDRWQKEVRAYWTAYSKYLKAIPIYEAYRSEVQQIFAEWDKIHAQWRDYYARYKTWYDKEEARKALVEAQRVAQEKYDGQVDACSQLPQQIADWQTAHDKWETQDIPAWEAEVAQYNANYPVLYAQYETAHENWRTVLMPAYRSEHQQWEVDHKKWEKKKQGPEPVEPTKPREPQPPTPPVKPTEPRKPTLPHPCPPVKDPVLSQKVPAAKDAPKEPADPRP